MASQIAPTLQNAPLTGAQSVIQAYAKQIYDSIQRDGFYVRVPAGKQFYIYVTQRLTNRMPSSAARAWRKTIFNPETNQPTTSSRRNFPPDAAAYRNGTMP